MDNPALDIRATRTADDGTVAGLQITGTVKSPQVTIFSEPPMSQNRALHYIVMGRPPGEGTGADGNLLSKAASSLGLRGGNLLASSVGQGLGRSGRPLRGRCWRSVVARTAAACRPASRYQRG